VCLTGWGGRGGALGGSKFGVPLKGVYFVYLTDLLPYIFIVIFGVFIIPSRERKEIG
jgi:hypothetical protein